MVDGKAGQHIIIRVDANARIGTGHLMRCLALAQAWKDSGGEVAFITDCDNTGLLQRLSDEGFEAIPLDSSYPDRADWEASSQALAAHPNAWVVLDGYHFDPTYQRRIKEAGHPLLVIDDMAHLEHYYADIVLNQNLHAEQLRYSCEPYTQLMLGTQYVLLRHEFLRLQGWKREIPEVARKALITLGGSDFDNATLKVVRALNKLKVEDLEVRVVVGPSNPHIASLEEAVHRSPFDVRLLTSVRSMPDLMAWADVAVSASGSTCWEMAFMGLPTVLLVLADNQQGIAEGLDSRGVALSVGWYAEISELRLTQAMKMLISNSKRRKAMSENGRQLVNGVGTDRVISVMGEPFQEISETDHLRMRPASFGDAEVLWKWTNDPTVRAHSFHPGPIPLDGHTEWYKGKLAFPDTRIWILELNQVAVAQIRYDRISRDTAEIDLSVAPDCQGRGLGTRALILTSDIACKELGVRRVKGVVFSSNRASRRAFAKAGFQCIGLETISGELCQVFERACSESIEEGS